MAKSEDEERYLVVGGRRWRRQDPQLPDDVRTALLSHLGRGRSGVRQAKASGDQKATGAARARVDAAKHGLGERGEPWWEQSDAQRRRRWESALEQLTLMDPPTPAATRAAILDLLDTRAAGKTICPSEAARALHPEPGWRALMPLVRESAVALATDGKVTISRRGETVEAASPDDLGPGPIRIGHPDTGDPGHPR